MNVLWIMCDQLRHDYLGCTGHPHIQTPVIDKLSGEGVSFEHAYAQSTICGPSRMSAYTGRYVRSHGSSTNESPLRVGEPTLGDHLREEGVEAVLIGKTHMVPDAAGLARLGVDTESLIGVRASECGFDPFVRDDGLHPDADNRDPDYFDYLRSHGYEADNPWETWANSAQDIEGNIVSGWLMRHARKPARVPAHLNETAFITDRTLDFMRSREGSTPWVAHVSYIKPHWPYIAPAPYHSMYGPEHVLPANRAETERNHPHPIMRSFQEERFSTAFARNDVRETVIPTYMGLISQIDDEIGRLIAELKETGQYDNTIIIFSSDHGDYLGDHWLGEKQMFHDPSVRIPLIIRDPRPEADATRGTTSPALVELIDIAPTLLDLYGGAPRDHIFEGHSLRPLLEGQSIPELWRSVTISEYDYRDDKAYRDQARLPAHPKMIMAANHDWKLLHFEDADPILFDRRSDPNEITDVSGLPDCKQALATMYDHLFAWARRSKSDICRPLADSPELAEHMKHYDVFATTGYPIGYWSEEELEAEYKKEAAFKAAE